MMRILAVFGVMLGALPAAGQDDPDVIKTSRALYMEAMRLETERPYDYAKAILKYKKAADRAVQEFQQAADDGGKKTARGTAAEALYRAGACAERLDPPNIADAQAAYSQIVSQYSDTDPWGARAGEKAKLKGVDIHLRKLADEVTAWRHSAKRSPKEFTEKKDAVWGLIEPLGADAIPGLLAGLNHDDDVVRDFCAEKLTEIVDGPGVGTLVENLRAPNPKTRAGAAAALRKVLHKLFEAEAYDRMASELVRDTDMPLDRGTDRSSSSMAKLKPRSDDYRRKAGEIRRSVPESLDRQGIQSALTTVLSDEACDPLARMEAARAVGMVGRLSGTTAEAVLKGMSSDNPGLRAACCRAAGAVEPTAGSEKAKFVARLMEVVRRPPSSVGDSADWPNDDVVRQAAAEAIECIGAVPAIPALVDALDDPAFNVRNAAHGALRWITQRDFGYIPDAPRPDRLKGQEGWKTWWEAGKGVAVIVERFWTFQSRWNEADAVKLFDPPAFLKEVESAMWTSPNDAKPAMDRARYAVETFQRLKDGYVQEALDMEPPQPDLFAKFIGGEIEAKPGESNPATRWFVGEVCAKLAEKRGAGGSDKFQEILSQDPAPRKIGAAIALGMLSRENAGSSARSALASGLSDPDPGVKRACAWALGKVGDDSSISSLTSAAVQANDVGTQIEALRALALLKPKGADTIQALGDLVADEPGVGTPSKKSPDRSVRQYASEALGSSEDASAIPFLIRARRDTMRNVWETAKLAIQKVYKANSKPSVDAAMGILQDHRRKTDDRIGAAYSLGDMGDTASAKAVSGRLIDENPPAVLRDADPGVRIALCQALGDLKVKNLPVVERLLQAMTDDGEREGVRNAACKALQEVTGEKLEFSASAPAGQRKEAISAWQEWFKAQKDSLSSE